jgi:hypothetical protein
MIYNTYLCRKNTRDMETKKQNFIIKHFGCYTIVGGKKVLTSFANASRVPVEEFWDVFSSDAERIFDIRVSEFKNEIHLTLDERIRKNIERELGLR